MSANDSLDNFWNKGNQSTPVYDQTNTTYNKQYGEEPEVGVGSWVLILLILVIPVVNIIMLLIWSIRKDVNPTKKAFSKAFLFWLLVMFTIILVLTVVFYDTFNYAPAFEKMVKIFRYVVRKIIGRFR